MRQIEWQDRFNIGVDIVDQAHQRLFAIVQKIMDLYIEKHEDKFAAYKPLPPQSVWLRRPGNI